MWMEEGHVTYVLAGVMAVGALLFVAAIVRPGLLALGPAILMRLGPADATEPGPDGWDYEELLARAVDHGMPRLFARWLRRPGHRRTSADAGDDAVPGDVVPGGEARW